VDGAFVHTIAHPTDFSEAGASAFEHALRLAIATQARLMLLHVRDTADETERGNFPRVREVLARWGFMHKDEPPSQIKTKLGVKVAKVDIHHRSAADGLFEFILGHRADLLVMATHGREGLSRYVSGSVSEDLSQRTRVPTLFIGPNATSFVDAETGQIALDRILLPVAQEPSPHFALSVAVKVLAPLGVTVKDLRFVHVGAEAPRLPASFEKRMQLLDGEVVDTLLTVARQWAPSLVVMPTAGHKGFVDALKGSTTEQILRQAPAPVLAIRCPEADG
jgi:nucleotide-binding universal stress UspA family protein